MSLRRQTTVLILDCVLSIDCASSRWSFTVGVLVSLSYGWRGQGGGVGRCGQRWVLARQKNNRVHHHSLTVCHVHCFVFFITMSIVCSPFCLHSEATHLWSCWCTSLPHPFLTLSLSPLCITMALTPGQKYPLLDGRWSLWCVECVVVARESRLTCRTFSFLSLSKTNIVSAPPANLRLQCDYHWKGLAEAWLHLI